MKLRAKFALYNTLSKLAIILVFVLVLPLLIKNIAIVNTDAQLNQKKEQVIRIIDEVGIAEFIEEGSGGTYGSYNLLKEEFISLEQNDSLPAIDAIENSARMVEDEIVDYRVLTHSFVLDGKQYILEVGRSLGTIQEIERTLQKFGLVTLLLIALLTTVSDIAFTKILLAPLKKIVAKLRDTRDPTSFRFQQVDTTTTDFRYLDESIHDMMTRLEEVFTKEREFISNVSHQLLTPISILQSKLENLLTHNTLSEEAETKLIESQKSLSRLKGIVQSLLLISKIENKQFLRQDYVSIQNLIDEVHQEIEDRLDAKGVSLGKEGLENFTIEQCNKALLHTMIFNIINNSIRYNKTGGHIEIVGFSNGNAYQLDVRDNGVGIGAENVPVLFSRFKRFQQSDSDSYGLGLPIVKTIADFHQIEIDVTSIQGMGTTFSLIFKKQP